MSKTCGIIPKVRTHVQWEYKEKKKKKAKEICEWLRISQNEQTQKHTYRNLSEHQAGNIPRNLF